MTQKQRNILILILGFIAMLGPFSIDMYLPGFPAIAKDLNTDVSQVSLTLTSYFIGIAFGQIIYGPLLDRYGRKKPLVIGLGIYIIACIGCAFVPNIEWLIALRLIMALGGCVGMVASQAIVRDKFEANETASVFSTLLLVMGVAPIIAPTMGGFISAHFGWKAIFISLAIIATIINLTVIRFLSESQKADKSVSLKIKDISSRYYHAFQNKQFLLFGLAGSVAMAAMFAYISGIPFIVMDIFGYSDQTFGWIFGLNAAGFITGSQVNRFLLRYFKVEQITKIAGLVLFILGILLSLMVFLNTISAPLLLSLVFLFLMMLGFINPNTTALSLDSVKSNAGIASALLGSFRMLVGGLVSALIGILHNGTALPMIWLMVVCGILTFILLFWIGKIQKRRIKVSN